MGKKRVIISAAAVMSLLGSYLVADAADYVPGFLTTSPAPIQPQPYPTVQVATPAAPTEDPSVPMATANALQTRAEDFVTSAHALGSSISVVIRDIPTGTLLADVNGATPHSTASSIKLLPAAALLLSQKPSTALSTSVVFNPAEKRLTLVGVGDMTLTDDDVAALARDTHSALTAQSVNAVTVAVDDTLFSGPTLSPAWSELDMPWVQPVMAVGVNSGKKDGKAVADPALQAAQDLADQLIALGTSVHGVERHAADSGDQVLSVVRDHTVDSLVTHTLKVSDNTTSEAVGRLVAVARGGQGTMEAGRAAVAETLQEAGFPTEGLNLADTCGLDGNTKATANLFTAVIQAAASGDKPELAPLLSAVPIAHLDGTLKQRLGGAAGKVRAKTGTLVTAVSLSGMVEGPQGQRLAFSILADGVEEGAYKQAREELDAFVTSLTTQLP